MMKAAAAVIAVNDSLGAQSANGYLMTFLTLTGLHQTSHHQTPLQAQKVYYAHAYGSATPVELSMKTCHPVTRMTVENMVNADQGSLFSLIIFSLDVLIVWLEKVIVSLSVTGNATAVEETNTFYQTFNYNTGRKILKNVNTDQGSLLPIVA